MLILKYNEIELVETNCVFQSWVSSSWAPSSIPEQERGTRELSMLLHTAAWNSGWFVGRLSSFFQHVQVCKFISFHAEFNVIAHAAACKLSVRADSAVAGCSFCSLQHELCLCACVSSTCRNQRWGLKVTYFDMKGTECSERLGNVW